MYPTKMEANGRIYEIDTDFRTAIACFKAINDMELTDLERFYAVETLLLGDLVFPQDEDILKDKIANFENLKIKTYLPTSTRIFNILFKNGLNNINIKYAEKNQYFLFIKGKKQSINAHILKQL